MNKGIYVTFFTIGPSWRFAFYLFSYLFISMTDHIHLQCECFLSSLIGS